MRQKVFLSLIILCGGLIPVHGQDRKTHWVDSVFATFGTEEKIGQLFMLTVPSNADPDAIRRIESDIKTHQVGGVIFQHETPYHLASTISRLQEESAVPLFAGQDAEWGLGQMMDSTISFPRPFVVGAFRNDSMIYRMGKETARQMKMVGLNLNFGPVADVNNNPQDPMISYRSYGENSKRVASKATAFMLGLQDHGVLSCVKHFAVKGLTVIDYQKDLPVVKASIDTIKAYPFQKLFDNHVAGVMPASSSFPLFYENLKLTKKNTFDAGTISLLFTGGWLRNNMGFKGLTFADLQQVKAATKKSRAGDAELFAFQAGNDILIGVQEIGQAIRKIKKLIRSDQQYEAQLDSSVKKILSAKYDAGLSKIQPLNLSDLTSRLNAPEIQLFNQKLYQQAVTVIRNDQNVLPVVSLENKHFAYLGTAGSEPNEDFYKYLSRYVNAAYFTVNEQTDLVELSDALEDQEVIVVGIFPQTLQSVATRLNPLLEQLSATRQIIYCDFGNATFLQSAGNFSTVITAYTNTAETLKAVPQVIFGALRANGLLPFTASPILKEGTGFETKLIDRLQYASPEDAQMSSYVLRRLEPIVAEAIRMGATPGCQVLVAKDGKVVYEKSFGSLNYDTKNPVTFETVYDLASLTKVSATLQAVMFMYEKGLIDIHKKVSFYLPELKKTNKKDITIIEILTHQAGLAPFIPMWTETVKDSVFLPFYYSTTQDRNYPLQVSPGLFATPVIRDSVWAWIGRSKLIEKPARTPYPYRYSDLGFLILQRLAEKVLNQPLDDFLNQNLYEPLGSYTMGFKPLEYLPSQSIAPTEYDKIFRKALVAGTVHDERAAIMGGVAGHAGLFSNANDLAKLGQMLLQGGHYGGYRYYKTATVNEFARRQFDKSRRGLGWDKPVQSDWNSPTSTKASPKTFGHTGFTGTCLWIDPEFNLVYVFLSNRVHPDRNSKLITSNIRSRIQDVIYESIFEYCSEYPEGEIEPASTVVSSRL